MTGEASPSSARSRNMAAIKGKDTKPELIVRKALHAHGFRYRLHSKALPGKPDLVLPAYRVCIFVHGCFWHRHRGCRYAYSPSTRTEFWEKKFRENVARDRRNRKLLLAAGWSVIELWECGLKKKELNLEWLYRYIKSPTSPFLSWPFKSLTEKPSLLLEPRQLGQRSD